MLTVIADFESYPQWAKEDKAVSVLSDDDGRADEVELTLDAGDAGGGVDSIDDGDGEQRL